jgi:hypothetical protein
VAPPLLLPEDPPLVKLPPDPDGVPELELHAPEIIPNAIAIARTDWTFIERLLAEGKPLSWVGGSESAFTLTILQLPHT